jgi:hypothetical protein
LIPVISARFDSMIYSTPVTELLKLQLAPLVVAEKTGTVVVDVRSLVDAVFFSQTIFAPVLRLIAVAADFFA